MRKYVTAVLMFSCMLIACEGIRSGSALVHVKPKPPVTKPSDGADSKPEAGDTAISSIPSGSRSFSAKSPVRIADGSMAESVINVGERILVFLGKCSTKRTDLSQHNQYYVNYKKEFLLRPNPSYGRMG